MLLNFDLLSSFDWARVQFVPRETLFSQLTPNLGFIDFETSSMILNIGTMLWLVAIYIFQVAVLYPILKPKKKIMPKSVKKWIKELDETLFFQDIFSKLDSVELVLLMTAFI